MALVTHLGDNCPYSQYIQGITISKWQVSGLTKGQQYNEYCDAGVLICGPFVLSFLCLANIYDERGHTAVKYF